MVESKEKDLSYLEMIIGKKGLKKNPSDFTFNISTKILMTLTLFLILFLLAFSISGMKVKKDELKSVLKFVPKAEIKLPENPTPKPTLESPEKDERVGEGCRIDGCNGEICSDAASEPKFSPCIYKPEFECYKSAICRKQENGVCSWVQSEELKSCLARF